MRIAILILAFVVGACAVSNREVRDVHDNPRYQEALHRVHATTEGEQSDGTLVRCALSDQATMMICFDGEGQVDESCNQIWRCNRS